MGRSSLYEQKKDLILYAIGRLTNQFGCPPSLRDLAEVTGISVSTLHYYLPRLAEEGLITWQPRSHRTVRLTARAREYL